MNPLYTIKKSAWAEITFWRVVLSILIIPLIVMICKIITIKKEIVEFYDDKIIHKRGWLTVKEDEYVFAGVYSVSVSQGIGGSLFNYGNLKVNVVGSWGDLSLDYVKDPHKAKAFLTKNLIKKADIKTRVTD